MAKPRFPLDNHDYAVFAWRRFRRILGWMALFSAFVAVGSVLLLWWWLGMMPINLAIAATIGIWSTIMLAAALMGLMFLSSGTGHDEAVDDFNRDAELDAIWDPSRDS